MTLVLPNLGKSLAAIRSRGQGCTCGCSPLEAGPSPLLFLKETLRTEGELITSFMRQGPKSVIFGKGQDSAKDTSQSYLSNE